VKKLMENWPLVLLWVAFGGVTLLVLGYLLTTPARAL
jgi:hypothetical protein